MNKKYLGFFALLGTSFIYGIFGIIVRSLSPYLTANQMTFARSVVVAVILGIILLRKKITLIKLHRTNIFPLIVHSVTFGLTIFLFTYSIFFTTLSKSVFSFYSTSLLTSLIVSLVFFKEGLSNRKIVSLLLAMTGLIFFILPSGINSLDKGMMFTAVAGISDVITNSMKKYLGGKVDRLVLVFYQMLTGFIIGSILITVTQELHLVQSLDLKAVAWLLFFSLNFFFLSYLTVYGFQHFDLNLGTIILSLEFVFASLAGYFVYGEVMTLSQIAASGLLILSIIVMNLPKEYGVPKEKS